MNTQRWTLAGTTSLLFLLGGVLWTPTLHAQDNKAETQDARAKRLYEVGAEFYDAGRYEAAIEAFEEAYKLSGRHPLLMNISSAYEKLGNLDKALEALEKFQPHSGDRKNTIGKRIASLKDRIATQEEANKATALAPTTASPDKTDPSPMLAPREEATSGTRIAAWSTLVGGSLLLAAGTTVYLLGESDHQHVDQEIKDGILNLSDPIDLAEAEKLEKNGDDKKLLGYAILGGGAVSVLTSIILFAVDGPEENQNEDLSLQLIPTPDGGMVNLGGHF